MPDRFLFLAGDFDVTGYVELVRQLNPACQVERLLTHADLLGAVPTETQNVRLLSFCSGTIVPRLILDRLQMPAYNIHPGSPDYPGSHPECWAAYFDATHFGATLHVMTQRVDEGAIIDTKIFETTPGSGQRELGEKAFHVALELLMRWTPLLINSDLPLPPNGQVWERRKWCRADRERFSNIAPDIGHGELERRRRAFAELPPGHLTLTIDGLDFIYAAPPIPPVPPG